MESKSLDIEPVEKNPLVVQVTRKLMDFLLSDKIDPGDRLPSERELSEALGVGRTTLREAMKTLTILGLLEVRHGDGTYLKDPDSKLLPEVIEWGLLLGKEHTNDLIEARVEIEKITSRFAASRITDEQLAELHEHMEQMKEADLDYEQFIDHDIAFHLKLAEAADNKILENIESSIQSLLRAWILSVLKTAGETNFSYHEHLRVYEAVKDRDPEAAQEAMSAHMDSASRRLRKAIKESEMV